MVVMVARSGHCIAAAATVPGTKDDLKPGLKVFVAGAPKLPDGSPDAAVIQIDKISPRQ